MKKVVKKLGESGRLEMEGNPEEGYVVREFRDDELYMETEFDDSDSAVVEALEVMKKWADHGEK